MPNNDVTNFRIDNEELRDLVLCQTALQNHTRRKIELMGMPKGTHYDAKFYRQDENGKMKLEYYVEIKRRYITETQYPDGIFKVEKENFLLQVQEEDKIPIKIIVLYPDSNSWYVYDADEVKSFPTGMRWIKETEYDPDSKKVLTNVHLLPLNKERRFTINNVQELKLPFKPLPKVS